MDLRNNVPFYFSRKQPSNTMVLHNQELTVSLETIFNHQNLLLIIKGYLQLHNLRQKTMAILKKIYKYQIRDEIEKHSNTDQRALLFTGPPEARVNGRHFRDIFSAIRTVPIFT